MRILGVILAVFGGLILAGFVSQIVTHGFPQDSNEALGKIGAFGIALLFLALGWKMATKKKTGPPPPA